MNEILEIIKNILNNPSNQLIEVKKSKTKANLMGDTLEEYIKNVYANTFHDNKSKLEIHEKLFSWNGNQNNPPDLIIRNGISIEVKKIEGYGNIALNSSFPKTKINSASLMITKDCRNCENNGDWEKDLVYCIGTVKKNIISDLFIVYGELYAADEKIYTRVKDKIKNGIEEISSVEFTETNELGKVRKVDPLGITDLRIRGMWSICHPYKVYDYLEYIISSKKLESKYVVYALLPLTKISKIDNEMLIEFSKNYGQFNYCNVKIKNPSNPIELIDCILIRIIF